MNWCFIFLCALAVFVIIIVNMVITVIRDEVYVFLALRPLDVTTWNIYVQTYSGPCFTAVKELHRNVGVFYFLIWIRFNVSNKEDVKSTTRLSRLALKNKWMLLLIFIYHCVTCLVISLCLFFKVRFDKPYFVQTFVIPYYTIKRIQKDKEKKDFNLQTSCLFTRSLP